MKDTRRCWLLKSEPDTFSFADLMARPGRREAWDGVRNDQARNHLRDDLKPGDPVLFYHSSCQPPHIAGLARVASEARPDPTQFDPASKYFDPKASAAAPRWFVVEVEAVVALPAPLSLEALKADPRLCDMLVARRGQRLSVMPVDPAHFDHIVALSGAAWPE